MIECYVDCREDDRLDKDFQTLNLWGKPVFLYVVEQLRKCKYIDKINVVTNSKKITNILSGHEDIELMSEIDEDAFPRMIVSGRAAFLKASTIDNAIIRAFKMEGGVHSFRRSFVTAEDGVSLLGKVEVPCNCFSILFRRDESYEPFLLDDSEATVINTKNDFELALVLQRKNDNLKILKKAIQNRIQEKKSVLSDDTRRGVCLIGHSQIDYWTVDSIAGLTVRNCGIAGISSWEYDEYILKEKLLSCAENQYVVMHGTNDIVYDVDIEIVINSIKNTIDYIMRQKPNARIYFIGCIHVNGRMDRSNKKIDCLNSKLKNELKSVTWIDTQEMDDECGDLKNTYTKDGLHLSDAGYAELERLVSSYFA